MNSRILRYPFYVTELPKYFKSWRENTIEEMDKSCKIFQNTTRDKYICEYRDIAENLKTFPKAIVRLTRQMCNCDEDCTGYSLFYTKFSTECLLYDLDNLMTDDRYYSSELVDKKILYRKLYPSDYLVEEDALRLSVHHDIWELCENSTRSYSDLKCKAYDLKDYCKEDTVCYDRILKIGNLNPIFNSGFNNENCKNNEFIKNIRSIENKVGLPFLYPELRRTKKAIINEEAFVNEQKPTYQLENLCFIICIILTMMLCYVKFKGSNTSIFIIAFCSIILILFGFSSIIF